MIFYLPLVISIILFIMQAHFGLIYRVRLTVLTASIYTVIMISFFANHELVVIQYMLLIMFWCVSFSTYLQRNSWKKVTQS